MWTCTKRLDHLNLIWLSASSKDKILQFSILRLTSGLLTKLSLYAINIAKVTMFKHQKVFAYFLFTKAMFHSHRAIPISMLLHMLDLSSITQTPQVTQISECQWGLSYVRIPFFRYKTTKWDTTTELIKSLYLDQLLSRERSSALSQSIPTTAF